MFVCKYCGKVCKNENSLRNHERLCKENPNRQILKSNFIEWNKKRKELNIKGENHFTKAERLGLDKPIVSEETKEKIRNSMCGRHLTEEHKRNISNGMKNAVRKYPDSYSSCNINGRVKIYEYNGVRLNGKWEVYFAEFLDYFNIKWIRPIIGIEYTYKGETHLYYPDFYLPDFDKYVEIKGMRREKDYYKWNAVNNLIIIEKGDIEQIKNKSFDITVFS